MPSISDVKGSAGTTTIKSPEPLGTTYEVQDGDTLQSIAEGELGDVNRWPELLPLNAQLRGDPARLEPGMVLQLPKADPKPEDPELSTEKIWQPGDGEPGTTSTVFTKDADITKKGISGQFTGQVVSKDDRRGGMASGTVSVTDNQIDSAEFNQGATAKVGQKTQLDLTGQQTWSRDGGWAGNVAGSAQQQLTDRTAVSAGAGIDAEAGKVSGFSVTQGVTQQLGSNSSLEVGVKESFAKSGDRTVEATSAFKTLLGNTTIDTSGTGLTITNNTLTQAQFQSAVETAFGPDAQVGVGGKYVWSKDDGVSGDTIVNFKRTVGAVELNAAGELAFKKGEKPSGALAASIGSTLGPDADLSGNPNKFNLGGVVQFEAGKQSVNLDAGFDIGNVSPSVKLGGGRTAKVYDTADDAIRAKAQGVWSLRESRLEAGGELGATVQVGSVPVNVGFRVEGSKGVQVRALTLSPDKATAEKLAFLKAPRTAADVLRMRPHEQYTDIGTRTIGLGGSVSIGYELGVAKMDTGADMFFTATGDIQRDIERLDGDSVRVRFTTANGKLKVKAFTAALGLDGTAVLPKSAVSEAAAPLLEEVASVGASASFEKKKVNETSFDVTLDLKTKGGKVALERLLANDLSEAQYLAGFSNSGVVMNEAVNTNLTAKTRTIDANISVLDMENKVTLLRKEREGFSADSYSFTEAVDRSQERSGFFSWDPDRSSDVRFVHESEVKGLGQAVPERTKPGQPLKVHFAQPVAPTLGDSKSVVGAHVKVTDEKTSLRDLRSRLNTTVSTMEYVGFNGDELKDVKAIQTALNDGIVPRKFGIVGDVGDQRFGDTAIEVEGFVGREGLVSAFRTASGAARTALDFEVAYLGAAKVNGAAQKLDATDLHERAARFTAAMVEAGQWQRQNGPPERKSGESAAVFAQRLDAYKRSDAYRNPEAYYTKLNNLFEAVVKDDGPEGTAALALLKLAGPDGIYGRAKVNVPDRAIHGIIRAGEDAVARFGAMSLLAGMQPTVKDECVLTIGKPGLSQDQVKMVAETLFGPNITVEKQGAGFKVTDLDFGWMGASGDDLRAVLAGGRGADGSLVAPEGGAAAHIFGPFVANRDGRLVFDNRSFDFVNLNFAVMQFGSGALTKDTFPTLVPSKPEAWVGGQDYGVFKAESTAVHTGTKSKLGTDFKGMLTGDKANLNQPTVGNGDWLLNTSEAQ